MRHQPACRDCSPAVCSVTFDTVRDMVAIDRCQVAWEPPSHAGQEIPVSGPIFVFAIHRSDFLALEPSATLRAKIAGALAVRSGATATDVTRGIFSNDLAGWGKRPAALPLDPVGV